MAPANSPWNLNDGIFLSVLLQPNVASAEIRPLVPHAIHVNDTIQAIAEVCGEDLLTRFERLDGESLAFETLPKGIFLYSSAELLFDVRTSHGPARVIMQEKPALNKHQITKATLVCAENTKWINGDLDISMNGMSKLENHKDHGDVFLRQYSLFINSGQVTAQALHPRLIQADPDLRLFLFPIAGNNKFQRIDESHFDLHVYRDRPNQHAHLIMHFDFLPDAE